MRNYLVLLIISFLFVCCSNHKQKKEKGVALELLNNEIRFVAIDSTLLLKSEEKNYSQLKSYTADERKLACNILTFKLVNNSSKKYYFVIDMNNFSFLGDSESFERYVKKDTIPLTHMCYLIDSNKLENYPVKMTYGYGGLSTANDSINIYLQKNKEIVNNIDKDITIPINNKNYKDFGYKPFSEKSFIIYPGEYKIFKKKLYLPIDTEKDHNGNLTFNAIILPSQYSYDFRLAISGKKDFIWNNLYDYQRKEIKDNGYEIFDGLVMSNKVPLKVVK